MCMFPSWIEAKSQCYFLTDKEIEEHGLHCGTGSWYDCIGHHAIRKVYPVCGEDKEGLDGVPKEFIDAIKSGKCTKMMEVGGYKKLNFWRGKLHSINDEPAIVYANGSKYWYKNGKLHRDDDKPAEVWAGGNKFWYKNGKLHRDGGKPAIVYANGIKKWYKNGKLHRDGDKPAIVYANGIKRWYKNGKLHRDNDKPAEVWAGGTKLWYKNGKFIK